MKKIYDIDMSDDVQKGYMIKERYQMLAEDPVEVLKYLMTHDVDQDYNEISIKECECKYGYFPKEAAPEYKELNYLKSDDPWARWRVSVRIHPEERFSYFDVHEVIAQTRADAILEAVRRMQRQHPDATPLKELKIHIERNDRKPLNFSI